MNLIEIMINNPIKIAVAAILTVLFGLVALTRLPMQMAPEVETPTLTVETSWPGASPQEIERIITMEQEEQLKGIEGLIKISSTASNSSSRITLEFQVGTNMQEALLKVNSRLQQVRDYPIDAFRPVISTADLSNRPIAWFSLGSRLPDDEQIAAFLKKYPQHKEPIDTAFRAHNRGVVMLRLRGFVNDYPEFQELLPPIDRNVAELRQLAEDEIEARFERVKGVAQSEVFGGLIQELQVIVDPEKLAARGLTLSAVRDVLMTQNMDTSAGDFWDGKRKWIVRSLGQFRSVEQVENQLLAINNNAPVYVRDVATVELGFKKPTSLVRRFGESTISINAVRETGANVLEVMSELREVAAKIDNDLLKPMGLQLINVYDETKYIYSALDLVRENIFLGGSLTMIVLMAFLNFGFRMMVAAILILLAALASVYLSSWYFILCIGLVIAAGFSFARGSLIVGLSIPISIITSFLVLQALGRSLNVVSLAGMAFAVGMLIDNAVVVLENIYRHFEMGKPAFNAAVDGTKEVIGAVFASTVTTVAVFLPVVFIQQEAGQLFRDIALAISTSMTISLIVAITVVPNLAARLLGYKVSHGKSEIEDASAEKTVASTESQPTSSRFASLLEHLLAPLTKAAGFFSRSILAINAWFQRGAIRQIFVVALISCLSVGLSWWFWPKVEYLPTGNQNMVNGTLLPPPSYNLDQVIQISNQFDQSLRPYWNTDPGSEAAKHLDYPLIGDFHFVAGRSMFMGIQAYNPKEANKMVDLLRSVGNNIPGCVLVAKQASLFEGRGSGGRTVEIELTGPDLPNLVELGGIAMQKASQLIPDAQIRPVPSLDLSMPEIHINPKLEHAAEMGISSRELGYAANALVDGAYAGDYYLDGRKIDVTLQGIGTYSDSTEKIEALPISTPTGHLVPISAVATVDWASGPEQIMRRDRSRSIVIEVSPPANFPLETAMELIQSEIIEPMVASGQLGGVYRANLAGTADKLTAVKHTFFGKWDGLNFDSFISVFTSQFVLVILVTYLLMAGLFESWLYPLVIVLTVPFGIVGGVLGLNLLNVYLAAIGEPFQQLDVLTMLGFVILIGTVINNPILIVHQALNFIRHENYATNDAILASVESRIRPIFMTTVTTVFGLLPLVLFPGSGSELYRGLGSVVLGGLIVSTIFTLVLVPAMFNLAIRVKQIAMSILGVFRRLVIQPS